MERYIPYFKTLRFFEGFETDHVRNLANRLKPLRIGSGEVLVRTGDTALSAFILVKGNLEVLAADGSRRLAILRPGESIGLASLVHEHKRPVSCRATGDAFVFELDRAVFQSICETGDELGFKLAEKIARMLAGQLRQIDGILDRMEDPTVVAAAASAASAAQSRAATIPLMNQARPGSPGQNASPAAAGPAPAKRQPPRLPANATEEQLMQWIQETSDASGLTELDSVRVVSSGDTQVHGGVRDHLSGFRKR